MANGRSVDDLQEFLKSAASRGWFARATAASMQSAVDRVLGPLDGPEKLDVANIDIEDAIQRLRNRGTNVTANSLRTYKSRILTARKHFLNSLDDPNWRPPTSSPRATGSTRSSESRRRSGRRQAGLGESTHPIEEESSEVQTSRERGLAYPFPIRPDVIVTITNLPRDLKIKECERLAAFLRSLAQDFDPEKSPTP